MCAIVNHSLLVPSGHNIAEPALEEMVEQVTNRGIGHYMMVAITWTAGG